MTVFLGLIIPFIGTTLGAVPEIAARIRSGSNGCSLCVVSSDTCNGDERGNGQACISSGCGWIHYRNPVFADSGPGYSTSTHRMRGGRRPGMQSEKINDADSCCNDS